MQTRTRSNNAYLLVLYYYIVRTFYFQFVVLSVRAERCLDDILFFSYIIIHFARTTTYTSHPHKLRETVGWKSLIFFNTKNECFNYFCEFHFYRAFVVATLYESKGNRNDINIIHLSYSIIYTEDWNISCRSTGARIIICVLPFSADVYFMTRYSDHTV